MKTLLPVLAAAAVLAGSSVRAQEHASEVDRIFSWITPTSPGCAVAVAHQGKLVVHRAYGVADLERDVPIGPNTIFDAGSVVKQFVAAATLLLVEEGRLSLTEDIRRYIPELPDYGHTITLDHLLTHTSGIRDWTGLGPLTGRQIDALTVTLRQRGLNFPPGEEWSYSNGGYVLLKEVVARTSGTSFDEFTRQRLFEPLGMKSTRYLGDLREVVKNRALAYSKEGGRWKLDVQVGNERGGGGALLSTASDLITWNDALTHARLGRFVSDKLQEPATLSNGRKLRYGRGLFLDSNRGGRVIWHSGGAGGYSSLLARFPEQGLSVAMLCNADGAADSAHARRIFDLFVPGTAATQASGTAPDAAAGAAASGEVDLKAKVGLFFSETTGQPLRLGAEKGRLRIAGGPRLLPAGKDRFRNPQATLSFMSQDEFELHFVSTDVIELKSMEGKTTRYRRAQPYSPTMDDLKAFAGRWTNDETRGVFDLAPGNKGLATRLNDSQPYEFVPVDRDTFQLGGMILRFHRDEAGTVTALDYSNPVVRNIRFTRLQR